MLQKNTTASMTITEEFAQRIKADHKRDMLMRWAPVIVLVGMILIFATIMGSSFASAANLVSILNQLAIPLIVALGLTFVIMIGSIDLSINGTVGMAGSLAAVFVANTRTENDMGIWGLFLAIAVSVLVGLVIGLIHVKIKIPSFMVSFAFMYICIGVGMLSYGGIPPTITDPFIQEIPRMAFLGIPAITWIAIFMTLLCLYIQEYTPLGRHIYAVGTDESIPRSVGINVNRVKVLVFTIAGFCFGVAGVVGAIRLGQGQVAIGQGLMFPAQAAVVIGGTALSGGKGGIANTIVGVLIMTVLFNGLTILGVHPHIRTGVEGIIILFAVVLTVKRSATTINK